MIFRCECVILKCTLVLSKYSTKIYMALYRYKPSILDYGFLQCQSYATVTSFFRNKSRWCFYDFANLDCLHIQWNHRGTQLSAQCFSSVSFMSQCFSYIEFLKTSQKQANKNLRLSQIHIKVPFLLSKRVWICSLSAPCTGTASNTW